MGLVLGYWTARLQSHRVGGEENVTSDSRDSKRGLGAGWGVTAEGRQRPLSSLSSREDVRP